MANVIFDFDGTLADTFSLYIDTAYKSSPNTKRLPDEQINKLRRIPLLTALLRLGIPLWRLPVLALTLRSEMSKRMNEVQPYQGVVPVLLELRDAGHCLHILTSNSKENVQIFLRQHRIERVFRGVDTLFYAGTLPKAHAMRKLMKRDMLDSSKTYYVGNEVLDIGAAERAGVKSIAVTWGGFDSTKLKKSKPLAVVDNPSELLGLLQ